MTGFKPFLGARPAGADAAVMLLGAPFDATASYRGGARWGPARIREASEVLETYSLPLEADLEDVPFADAGDLTLPLSDAAEALRRVERAVDEIAASGRIPWVLGGEHLVTLGAVRALAARHPGLTVVQLDAHADLRDEYAGERLSHATVMRRVLEVVGAGRLYQFGVRSATAEEHRLAREATRFFPGAVLEPLRACLPELRAAPLYVTVDVDVLDPAYAPGTGTPEPAGVDTRELLEALRLLRGCRIVGADLVEVAPPLDPTERTQVVAARIVRDALIAWFGPVGGGGAEGAGPGGTRGRG